MKRLLLTSGRGPAECRIALKRTVRKLASQADEAGIDLDLIDGPAPDKHGPGSVIAIIRGENADTFASQWTGAIKWTFNSPVRPNHKRKNWFIGVFDLPVDVPIATTIDQRDVRFETFRAGGPGGQHQNNTDSAVRAIHTPTGLTVVARSERSQHRNKDDALKRLAALLRMSKDIAEIADQQNTQDAHDRLQRGNPIKTFEDRR